MQQTLSSDFDGLASRLKADAARARRIIAIAGAPGSGKSTIAARLEAELNQDDDGCAALMAMDGFHFDDAVLDARGLRARKGSPDTFDVGGLRHMLTRLKVNGEREIAVPVFDRDLEISRAGARVIPQNVRWLIVEGNYLLLAEPGWTKLHDLYDISVMIVVSEAVLRQRLFKRWQGYGLPPHRVTENVEENDLPNGRFVMDRSIAAQFSIAN